MIHGGHEPFNIASDNVPDAAREREKEERIGMRMTTEEAFVKVLQRHGIEHVFGIIGSAFMPISDLFPKAGITFWDVAHESNAGFMCDGYTRASGKIAMCIGQNGPGITNLVTPVKTAYWNHTPLLLVNHDTVALSNIRLCLSHRLMGRAPRAEPVAVFGKRRVPLRLKNLQHGLLDQSVDDTGDAEFPDPAVRLGYLDPLDRLGLVGSVEQLRPNAWPVLTQVVRGLVDGHPIDAGTALVLSNVLPRSFAIFPPAHLLH